MMLCVTQADSLLSELSKHRVCVCVNVITILSRRRMCARKAETVIKSPAVWKCRLFSKFILMVVDWTVPIINQKLCQRMRKSDARLLLTCSTLQAGFLSLQNTFRMIYFFRNLNVLNISTETLQIHVENIGNVDKE